MADPYISWLDRAVLSIAPRFGLRRIRARLTVDLATRHYEAAVISRRTQSWQGRAGDANAATGPSLARVREQARDVVRNNPYAESLVTTLADHVVGWGIVAQKPFPAWEQWANTTACDADGRNDLAGLQKLVLRTVVESGECLVRRRWRRQDDGFPLPFQLQVLEPDYLDTLRETTFQGGAKIVQGVEFDPVGRRSAYWIFPEHPGTRMVMSRTFGASVRVPATELLHIFRAKRPGQVRGMSTFAPILLRLKDLDDYEDAALMKQKIAACLAVLTTDVDGTSPALGVRDSTTTPELDMVEPGGIHNLPPGRAVTVVNPPRVDEHSEYTAQVLRSIATGGGVTYEDLTGDYQDLPFSAARMSRIRHWARIEDWRWQVLVPQLCDPVWRWALEAAVFGGVAVSETVEARWTAPPMPMIEPDKEGLAIARNIRAGITSLSESLRERGYDPEVLLTELSKDFQLLDRLGIRLDCDPRNMTQAGQLQGPGLAEAQASEREAAMAAALTGANGARR